MSEHVPNPRPGDYPRPLPYVPPDHFFLPEFRMQRPRAISLAPGWLFDAEDYERLRMGYEPSSNWEPWVCYMSDSPAPGVTGGSFHAHRAATGHEIFRMPLTGDGVLYLARDFIVEQDATRYRLTKETVIRESLAAMLGDIMQAPPVRFD